MLEDRTAVDWEADGFFHTGDIGQFMEDGIFRIVDWRENLAKLKGGDYIAIEQKETNYGNRNFVDAVGGGARCY
jgi:long-chain acyl-CoA synthetase